MSFSVIVNSTATSPYDMNDNFIHVAQGSITPKTGSLLEETTSTINIGSIANTWNNAYFYGSISASTISTSQYMFREIEYFTLTLPTQRIEITGLNGDTAKHYFINIQATLTGGASFIAINGDSTGANYLTGSLFSVNYGNNNYYINARSGKMKPVVCFQNLSGYVPNSYKSIATITSMQFEAVEKFMSGTTIRLYSYGVD